MKDKKYFILTIISILVLSLITYQQFKSFREISSEIELPEFKMPEFKLPPSQESTKYEEFTSPDGKLKIKYPSDWLKLPQESLEKINEEIVKEDSKILFFAQKFNLEKAAFISLAIQELGLKENENLETVINGMKEEAKKEEKGGGIIKLEIKNEEAYFETKYEKEESTIFVSKEKVVLGENKVYIITFIAPEKDWLTFEKEVEGIFSSAQVVD
jgi:hypothetical protein